MFQPTLRVHIKRKEISEGLINDAYAIFFVIFLFVIFFIEAYVVGTDLNCIDKSMQFKWAPTTFGFKQSTGCNLKTTELLDCALIGICAVIRSTTVSEDTEELPQHRCLPAVHEKEEVRNEL